MVPLNNIDIDIINSKTMSLCIPNEKDSKIFKYEIYGNKHFHLFGSIEISKPNNMIISFDIPVDNLFFIKIIVLNNCNKISNIYTRFYNHIPINLSRNLSMNIIKKNIINEKKIKVLYDSSNTDNDSNHESEGDETENEYNNESGNESNNIDSNNESGNESNNESGNELNNNDSDNESGNKSNNELNSKKE